MSSRDDWGEPRATPSDETRQLPPHGPGATGDQPDSGEPDGRPAGAGEEEQGTRPLFAPPDAAAPGERGAAPGWSGGSWGQRDATTRWEAPGGGAHGQAGTGPVWGAQQWGQPHGQQPSWGQPPSWGSPGQGPRPAPGERRPSRRRVLVVVAAAVAVLLLGGGGYVVGALRDDGGGGQAAGGGSGSGGGAGAGIPQSSPPPVLASGEEPVAAVAKALLPTVVQIETGRGLGSGVIYDSGGYILTAAHVVEDVDTVTVRLSDGAQVRGEVLGADPDNDVAVVKVDRTGLQAAPLALDTEVQVGQMAVAIGSPFGLDQTVTAGVVSSASRAIRQGDGALLVIQTDAPINPGNSGGALADREGRVIGINNAIASESGGNQGVGFAIPIDVAAASAERIVKGEPPSAGFLGVSTSDPQSGPGGALVMQVESGSPADQAGIEVGDLIVAVNDEAVPGSLALAAQIRAISPGETVKITVRREGREETMEATLAARRDTP